MSQISCMSSTAVVGLLMATGLLRVAVGVESITLRSGNGPLGGPDSQITMLTGPADGPFAAVFTAADFASAAMGPAASVIGNHGAWIPALAGDPLSRWISTGPGGAGEGGTALYSQAFTVATPSVASAVLDLHYAVDNVLGSGGNVGVYLNGQPVTGTMGGTFSSEYSFIGLNVGGLLQTGLNQLCVYAVDQGGPGGLLYRADLSIEPQLTVGVEDQPIAFTLSHAWPNPFNPSTDIAFDMAQTDMARLAVHDLAGREVSVLVNGLTERGAHRVSFNAASLPAGLYFYTLQVGHESQTRKMMLVK